MRFIDRTAEQGELAVKMLRIKYLGALGGAALVGVPLDFVDERARAFCALGADFGECLALQ